MSIRFVLSLSIALLLSACSGSSDSPAPVPPAGGGATLSIDATNAKPALRIAYGATAQSVDTGGLVDESGIASTPDGGFSKPTASNGASDIVARFMQKDPVGPFIEDCIPSGTTTINLDVDPVSFLAGSLSIGDQIFVETTATDTMTSNGDSTVVVDTTGNPMVLLSISGNSLAAVSAASTETVTSFLTTQTVDTSVIPEPYTLDSSGTVNSSQLAGVIDFATLTTFQGMGAAYPYAGILLVTGEGSAVKLIALSDSTVRIETDPDGDGVFVLLEETTWDDIAL